MSRSCRKTGFFGDIWNRIGAILNQKNPSTKKSVALVNSRQQWAARSTGRLTADCRRSELGGRWLPPPTPASPRVQRRENLLQRTAPRLASSSLRANRWQSVLPPNPQQSLPGKTQPYKTALLFLKTIAGYRNALAVNSDTLPGETQWSLESRTARSSLVTGKLSVPVIFGDSWTNRKPSWAHGRFAPVPITCPVLQPLPNQFVETPPSSLAAT